jgi:hypothetical protein
VQSVKNLNGLTAILIKLLYQLNPAVSCPSFIGLDTSISTASCEGVIFLSVAFEASEASRACRISSVFR